MEKDEFPALRKLTVQRKSLTQRTRAITQGNFWFIVNHRGKSTLFQKGGAERFPGGHKEAFAKRSKGGKMEGQDGGGGIPDRGNHSQRHKLRDSRAYLGTGCLASNWWLSLYLAQFEQLECCLPLGLFWIQMLYHLLQESSIWQKAQKMAAFTVILITITNVLKLWFFN